MDALFVWPRLTASHDDAGRAARTAAWVRGLAARFTATGAEVLATPSSMPLLRFAADDVVDAIEAALELLDEAEREGHGLAVGAALGAAASDGFGAVERAALLAHRARAGDLVFDEGTHAAAAGAFLSARTLLLDGGGGRAFALDRAHPRRDAGAVAAASLGHPGPGGAESAAAATLVQRAQRSGPSVVWVHGPRGSGFASVLAEAARRSRPRVVVRLEVTASGLVPLGSLRRGLGVALGSPDGIVGRVGGDGSRSGDTLRSLLEGGLPERPALASALVDLFGTVPGPSAWVVAAPLTGIDFASLEALDEALALDAKVCLIARAPQGGWEPPARPFDGEPIVLARPTKPEAWRVVRDVLGPDTEDDVARRIAALGGRVPRAIDDVVRALVASGSLVRGALGFEFRGMQDGPAWAWPPDEVAELRFEALDAMGRHVLEVLAALPEGHSEVDAAEALAHAGLDGEGGPPALEALRGLGWWVHEPPIPGAGERSPRSRVASSSARAVVRRHTTNERRAAVLDGVRARLVARGEAAVKTAALAVELGWCEIRCGALERGVGRFLAAATHAEAQGYARAAMRLRRHAERALEGALDEANEPGAVDGDAWVDGPVARGYAPTVVELASPEPLPEADSDPGRTLSGHDAPRSVDAGALEAALRAGSPAFARAQALAALRRGDLVEAQRALGADVGPPSRAEALRDALTRALVDLHAGRLDGAARRALRALAEARSDSNPRAAELARRLLQTCLRRMGRVADADRLEHPGG